MDDMTRRVHELLAQGLCCTQAMVQAAMETKEESNPRLIEVLGALGNGMRSGLLCGAFSGGVCLMTLLAGRQADPEMFEEYREWFQERTQVWGGMNCEEIMQKDPALKAMRCPSLVEDSYRKALELLEDYM